MNSTRSTIHYCILFHILENRCFCSNYRKLPDFYSPKYKAVRTYKSPMAYFDRRTYRGKISSSHVMPIRYNMSEYADTYKIF